MARMGLHHRVSEGLIDEERFMARAKAEAVDLKNEVREGVFDKPQANVGLEYETYGVDDETGRLKRVPRGLLDLIGFEKELGLHNAELHTHPMPLSEYGLQATERELQSRLEAATAASTRTEGIELVADGLWTIPPAGESAEEYLTAGVERADVVIGTNISESVRYHLLANGAYEPRCEIDVPNASLRGRHPGFASLTTTIQPHYQVPHAIDLPEYFTYALRIAGPLLALGVNSPFLPPDLYDPETNPEDVLEEGLAEHRIRVFESAMNPKFGEPKVRFPEDVATTGEAIDRIAEDSPLVPMAMEPRNRYDDRFVHFNHKHGTFWRWVRPVFEGESTSAANARIEFRPLPNQPTVRDGIAFLALYSGLLKRLVHISHPVAELEWETAKSNFEAVVAEGLDAEMVWITAGGSETRDTDAIYEEIFTLAVDGLLMRGIDASSARRFLEPIRQRAERGLTPAGWKRERFREAIAEGATLDEAIHHSQRAYLERQAATLLDGTFVEWSDGESES